METLAIFKRPFYPIREIAKWGYSFIPLSIRNGKRFFNELEFLNRSQWWSKQELENYQSEKLRELIKHAYKNVPYYHRLFNENKLTPESIKTIRDLPKIPALTKDIVRRNAKDFIATNFKQRDLKKLYTSGTTGEPLYFYVDKKNEYLTGDPTQWRYFGWGDYTLRDIRAEFGSFNLAPHLNGRRRLFQYNPVRKCLLLSINDLHRENIRDYVSALEQYRPPFLKTFPSALEAMVRFLKEESIVLDMRFRAIFTDSEILYPWQSKLFKEYFGCPVLDWYALEERVAVGAECREHCGHHISSEYGIVEFIKDEHSDCNPGCSKIIATGLTNFGMPLIRYNTGDLGALIEEKCSCGRGLPLMKLEGGRKRNFAISKKGSLIPITLIDIPNATDNLWQFQFIQEKKGQLHLNIIKKDSFSKDDLDKIKMKLDEKFGMDMDVFIHFTTSVQRTTNRKTPVFIQRMANNGIIN
jgi:phenylacetate-CoA ligase